MDRRERLGCGAFATVHLSSAVQFSVAVFSLVASRNIARLNVYVTALLLATVATIAASEILPALGAYPTFGLATNPTGAIGTYADVLRYKVDVLALRLGTLRDLSGPFVGIITFPSYHAVVAVLAAWATCRIRWLGAINGAGAAVVVLITLPIGGRHFVDLIAGAFVAVASVAMAWTLESRLCDRRRNLAKLGRTIITPS
jgi:PAP2 superfamily